MIPNLPPPNPLHVSTPFSLPVKRDNPGMTRGGFASNRDLRFVDAPVKAEGQYEAHRVGGLAGVWMTPQRQLIGVREYGF